MSHPDIHPDGFEDFYRAIVEAQEEFVSLAKADGTLLYVNPAYARHYGFVPEQMIGRSFFDYVPESDRPSVRRVIDDVLADGKSLSTENRIVSRGGELRWIAWTNGILLKDGETLIRSVGRDVTERKALEREVLESEAFVRNITDSLPLRIAYVDRELRYRFVNEAHCQRFNRPREEVIGRSREDLLGTRTPLLIHAHIEAVLDGEAQRFEYDEMIGDELYHVEVQLVPDVGPDGQVQGYFYTGLDVTKRTRAEQALRDVTLDAQRQSDVLRLVTDAIPATVIVVGSDERYRFANKTFEAHYGLPRERIIGRTAAEILGEQELARRRPFMARALAGEVVSFELDYAEGGSTRWVQLTCIPLRLGAGDVDGFVGIGQDVTAQKREQARLTELAQRDPLTGLLNRSGFELCLERLIDEGRGAGLGLLYIDLDGFKAVNDRHGHPVGDMLLKLAAQRLSNVVRPTDAVARLGGDEFAVLLVDSGLRANVEAVAAKVVAEIGKPFDLAELKLVIGASVGVAFGVEAQGDWHELIQRADAMLYRAKASGRGRYAG